ncbi:MAG: tetratricopeptide repeat protein [Pseudomonadota bacterium]
MLLKADQLYRQKMYEDAQGEYLKLTSMPDMSSQQKAIVYFKLGITNYRLNEYELAIDSFLKSAEFNTGDPVAYNNAAVCAFYENDLAKAEEYQKKAVSILPVVEYYYNLARIYEASEQYEDAVKYYSAVTNTEENITREDRIDPVRIKNKIMKLLVNIKNADGITKELMMALKLKDSREVFVIEDVNMDIKGKDFKWNIIKEDGYSRLYSSYDRKKLDPYNLIESLKWTVKKEGKTIYTDTADYFSVNIMEGNNYTVYLDIKYGADMQVSSYVQVMKGSVSSSKPVTPTAPAEPPKVEERCRYYPTAIYEQVFEKSFDISEQSYVDRFGVVWGKDAVETTVMTKDFRDAGAALLMNNTSKKRAGIWTDLSSVVKDKQLRGRTIRIRFQARKITDEATLNINIRTKTGKSYSTISKKPQLEFKWQEFVYDMIVPLDADGLTMSFRTNSGEEIKMDAFYIQIIK